MIPKNITRKDVEDAIERVRRHGVPRGRGARGFAVRVGSASFPPKYLIALANIRANGQELSASEFSGGAETNTFLRRLGFVVVPDSTTPTSGANAGPFVATVLLETDGGYSKAVRLASMETIVAEVASQARGRFVALFSGGWFKAGSRHPRILAAQTACVAQQIVSRISPRRGAVSFGVDGADDRVQLAALVDSRGVRAMARKFHEAPGESIVPAGHWADGEDGHSRIAHVHGRRLFLAVCYDSFGIAHRQLERPEVDGVLDHVHSFGKRGSNYGSGDVLFARHGLAAASREWRVPVFGAARFIDRRVPDAWPSAVAWRGRTRSTLEWKYRDNAIAPSRVLRVPTAAGLAVVRLFPLAKSGA